MNNEKEGKKIDKFMKEKKNIKNRMIVRLTNRIIYKSD